MYSTNIEWYKTAEALPAKSGRYLLRSGNYITVTEYSSKWQLFNTCDQVDHETAKMTAIECSYWAIVPEFPEDEPEDESEDE